MDSILSGKFRSFFQSSYFLALPVALAVIFFMPSIFSKYHSELAESGLTDKKGGFEYFVDVDQDGNSEKIVVFNNTEGKASIKIVNHDGFIRGHHYFNGQILPSRDAFIAGPFDTTGQVALFLMSLRSDSLFLNCITSRAEKDPGVSEIFITVAKKTNDRFDYTVNPMFLYDIDNDGTNEVISGIMAGFPLQPRFAFICDINDGKLLRSPLVGSFFHVNDTADIDGNGRGELLTHSYAIGNYPDTNLSVPYGDHSAWLMVFDSRMKFLFPPGQYRGTYISLTAKAIFNDGRCYIAGLQNARTRGKGSPRLLLFDSEGSLLKSKIIDDSLRLRHYSLYIPLPGRDRLWLIREGGLAEEFDHNLETIRKKVIGPVNSVGFIPLDIDLDGKHELIFSQGYQHKAVITRDDLSAAVILDLSPANSPVYYSVKREKGKPGQLYIQQGDRYWIFSYGRNPWYYFRFPVYLAVYLLVLGFIALVQYQQRRILKQKYEAERKIAEMQLLLMKNQLDPHFTFNAINSISASILQDRPEEANRNLVALSKLMRSCVTHGETLSQSVAEEIEFLQNYLELMKNRLNGGFSYTVEIDPGIDLQWQIPRMVTQIYAENAIRHGLQPLNGSGKLTIRLTPVAKSLFIEIEDNGIGRTAAAGLGSEGTGKGMKVMEKVYSLLNRYNERKITCEVIDLFDQDLKPSGTLVRIVIPAGLRFGVMGK